MRSPYAELLNVNGSGTIHRCIRSGAPISGPHEPKCSSIQLFVIRVSKGSAATGISNLAAQPGASVGPMPFGRWRGYAERLRGFLDAQTVEKAQLD